MKISGKTAVKKTQINYMAKNIICKLYLPIVRYCSEHAFESCVATFFFLIGISDYP